MRHRLAAIVLLLIASALPLGASAAACSVDLTGNDAMKYSLSNIDISKTCKTFTINFKHIGKMARNVMGHNVVIARTADMSAIEKDGAKAGLASEYIKPADARVIAHSKVVGGGQGTSVEIPLTKLTGGTGPFSFFCSFPGHAALMKGSITLKP